jgi:hypothetical protein
MYQKIQLAVLGVIASLFVLGALSRRLPGVRGLQPFQQVFRPLSPAQREVARRRSDMLEGIKFILMGLVLPIGYVALKVMMFNDPTLQGFLVVAAGSLLCFVLGAGAIRSGLR